MEDLSHNIPKKCISNHLFNIRKSAYAVYLQRTMTEFHETPFSANRGLVVQGVLHHLKYSILRTIALL